MAGRFPRRVTNVVTTPQGLGLEIKPSQGNRGAMTFASAGVGTSTFTPTLLNTAPLYGLPWNADDLDNLEIGLTGDSTKRRVGIRFRAPVTDTLQSIALAIAYGTGYSLGTGGSVKCALQADDGTANHFPSGTDIASVTVTTPNGTPDTESVVTWTFSSPPTVTAGVLYHLVFTNVDASPTTNWVSFDGTYNNPSNPGLGTQAQPYFADTDWYVNRFDGPSPGWTAQPQVSASPVNLHFVSSSLDYGWSVDYTPVVAAVRNIGGANAVRMKFTPSATITVVRMFARAYRQSGTTHDLSYQLKDNSGTILASGTVPVASFPSGSAGSNPGIGFWGSVGFSPVTLTAGSTYTFELWATGETVFYQAYPLRTAETGNWSDAAGKMGRFDDGHWEYSTNSGSTWTEESSDVGYKMQAYFTTDVFVAGTFSSTGTGNSTFTLNRRRNATFSSTGSGTTSCTANRRRNATFSSTGTGTSTFARNRLRDATFSSTGSGTSTWSANRLRDATFSSAGSGTSSFAANRLRDATFSSAGTGTSSFGGAAKRACSFSSTGSGTSAFAANRFRDGVFSSTGTGASTFALNRLRPASMSSTGTGNSAFACNRLRNAAFSSTGTGTSTFARNRWRDATFSSTGSGASTFAANRWRDAAFSSTGAGSSSFAAAAKRAIAFSSAGVGTSTFTASSSTTIVAGTFSSSGSGSSTFAAAALRATTFSSTGASSSTFACTRRRNSAFGSAGSGSSVFTICARRSVFFNSTGIGTSSFNRAARRALTFTSPGTGTSTWHSTAHNPLVSSIHGFDARPPRSGATSRRRASGALRGRYPRT